MSIKPAWKPGIVHLKTTTKEDYVTFTRHPCWNTDLFLANAQEIAEHEGGKVEAITPEEFERNR